MAGSMWSSDGSGVVKNSPGGRSEMVILYAISSLLDQSLPDLADRMILAIATLKSEDGIRVRAPPKTPRWLWLRLSGEGNVRHLLCHCLQ